MYKVRKTPKKFKYSSTHKWVVVDTRAKAAIAKFKLKKHATAYAKTRRKK
jgi:hypothetical protein